MQGVTIVSFEHDRRKANLHVEVDIGALYLDLSQQVADKRITQEIMDKTLTSQVYSRVKDQMRECLSGLEGSRAHAARLRAMAAKLEAEPDAPMLKSKE